MKGSKQKGSPWVESFPTKELASYFATESNIDLSIALVEQSKSAVEAHKVLHDKLQKVDIIKRVTKCNAKMDDNIEDADIVTQCKSDNPDFVLVLRFHKSGGKDELTGTLYDTDGSFVSGFSAEKGIAIEPAPEHSEGVDMELMESIRKDQESNSGRNSDDLNDEEGLYVHGTNKRLRFSQGRRRFKTRLTQKEFFQLVGRPDLASKAQGRRTARITGKVAEYILFPTGVLFLINGFSIAGDQTNLLGRDRSNAIPSIVGGTVALLTGAAVYSVRKALWSKEVVSLQEARQMAESYNEELLNKQERSSDSHGE